MKILVVGSGGREHALCWRLMRSASVDRVFCAPGNAGTGAMADNVDVAAADLDGLARFALRERIDLTVVGPEVPLAAGIKERFSHDNLVLFGPSKRAAELEGSKVFAKQLMRRFGIPTAEFRTFEDYNRAARYVADAGVPLVIKADGLAAGKGVIVTSTAEEALDAVGKVMKGAFGSAGAHVVIEERLEGEEASIIAITDGKTILSLPSSQDHKAAYDNDEGPNTGGMGAYSPAPVVTEKVMDKVIGDVLVQTVHAMEHVGRPYVGVIYAGIMVTSHGIRVLEFNCRFGDPETQPLMLRVEGDFAGALMLAATGKLEEAELDVNDKSVVAVVMASEGYPGKYEKGKVISGIDEAEAVPGVTVFHAGTKRNRENAVVTDGGRVLAVAAEGKDIREAQSRAYEGVDKIHYDGAWCRRDIAAKALKRDS
ncbi:MAG: phosphoribosylamine--glycine ligase [Planctomycetes bacterium]|nr:phosphoribosylamine--glycine ligase [Planctomycetota bacterium]